MKVRKISILFVIFFAIISLSPFFTKAVAPSNIITYQGRLLDTNGVPVADASLNITFTLYDSLAAGTCLWSNNSATCATTTARAVTLTDGLFSENLGDTTLGTPYAAINSSVFANNAAVYLEIIVAGETLTPRKLLTAAPYALNAQTLDGLDSLDFLQASNNLSDLDDAATARANLGLGALSILGSVDISDNTNLVAGTNITLDGDTLNVDDAFLLNNGDTATGNFDFTGAVFSGGTPFTFEGATSDDFETFFVFTDPTADNTITFKNASGTVAFVSDITTVPAGASLWEVGTNGTYETDAAVIIGTDVAFDHASGAAGDLRIADELEVIGNSYFDGNLSGFGQITFGDNGDTFSVDSLEFDIGASTGSITINDDGNAGQISIEGTILDINSLSFIGNGEITASANSNILFTPAGTGDVVISTDSDSQFILGGLDDSLPDVTTGENERLVILPNGIGDTFFPLDDDSNFVFNLTGNTGALSFVNLGYNTGTTLDATASVSGLVIDLSTNLTMDGAGNTLTGISVTSADGGAGTACAIDLAGSPDIDIDLSRGERIVNNADGAILLQGAGGTLDTGIYFDLDAATVKVPTLRSLNNDLINIDDGLSIGVDGDTAEGITNGSFAISGGNDLYVAGMAGIVGDVYTNGSFVAGASSYYADGYITDSGGDFTFTLNSVSDDLNLINGNLAIGNDAPTSTLNGEDFYVEGSFEADGVARFDGTAGFFTSLASDTGLNVLDITFTDTAAASTATNYLMKITNADDGGGTGAPDAFIFVDQGDANESVATGILFTDFGGGFGKLIDSPEFDVDGGTGSIDINDDGNAGQVSVEGTILDINSLSFVGAGTIASAGAFDINPTGNLTITLADGESVLIDGDSSPTADLLVLGTGDTVATDGIDVLSIVSNITNASSAGLRFTPTYSMNTPGISRTISVIDIDGFTASADDGDPGTEIMTLSGLNIDTLTESTGNDGLILSAAMRVGDGWDSILQTSDTTPSITTPDDSVLTFGDTSGHDFMTLTGESTYNTGTLGLTGGLNVYSDVNFNFGAQGVFEENFTITQTLTRNNDINPIDLTFTDTAAASTATNYLMKITNTDDGGATGTPDAMVYLDQADTNELINDGIILNVAAGALTDAIDASDDQIVNALNTGSNFIDLDGIRFYESATGTLTFEDTSGNDLMTLIDNANTGDLTLTGDINIGEDAYIEGTLEVDGVSQFDNTVKLLDDVSMLFGSSGDASIIWVGADDDLLFDNNNCAGATVFKLGTDTSATSFQIKNNSGDQLFTVNGNGVTIIDSSETSGTLFEINAAIEEGTIINATFSEATVLSNDLRGLNLDLANNFSYPADISGKDTTGIKLVLPGVSETAGGAAAIDGFSLTADSLSTATGEIYWTGSNITIPAITQTGGSIEANGYKITTGSITTGGTEYGVRVDSSGVSAGSLYGINIDDLDTPAAGNETALNIGTGWDIGAVIQSGLSFGAQTTLSVFDSTPTVAGGSNFITGNTGLSGPITITAFDDGQTGQIIFVKIGDTNTIFDCDSLQCGSTDIEANMFDISVWFKYSGGSSSWDLISYMNSTANHTDGDGFDLAEYFQSADSLLTGEVVEIDPTASSYVKRSTGETYDNMMVGVVSTDPGLTLGDSGLPNIYPIALAGRVPILVTNENGTILAGDPLTSSSTPGYAMKATQAGKILGYALENFSDPSGAVMAFVQTSWQADGIFGTDGSSTLVSDTLIMENLGVADASTTGVASQIFALRGSGWNGSAAEILDMKIQTEVIDADNYGLSFKNTADSEIAYLTNEGTLTLAGDLIMTGKIYPSDRGVAQTSKYIYYDGSAGPGGDMMRTNASGWSTGSYDFAEMFPSDETLEAGDVVVFTGSNEKIGKTSTSYNKQIAGIISTRPGFLAGENAAGHFPVALAGRVPTKVNLEGGDITVGDPLTTSSTPGYAMKASKHGMIVGYALEPFTGAGDNKIVVFINATFFTGDEDSSLPGISNTASLLPSGSSSNFTTLNMEGGLYMGGNDILNIRRLIGMSDRWSIDEAGNIKTEGTLKTVINSYQNEKVETAAVTSTGGIFITLVGTAELQNGEAIVSFEETDPAFNDVTSTTAPIRVIATPNGPVSIYIAEKNNNGFMLRQINGNDSGIQIDWMATAYRKDHEPVEEAEVVEGSEEEDLFIEDSEPAVEPLTEAPIIEETLETETPVEEEAPEPTLEPEPTVPEVQPDPAASPIETSDPTVESEGGIESEPPSTDSASTDSSTPTGG